MRAACDCGHGISAAAGSMQARIFRFIYVACFFAGRRRSGLRPTAHLRLLTPVYYPFSWRGLTAVRRERRPGGLTLRRGATAVENAGGGGEQVRRGGCRDGGRRPGAVSLAERIRENGTFERRKPSLPAGRYRFLRASNFRLGPAFACLALRRPLRVVASARGALTYARRVMHGGILSGISQQHPGPAAACDVTCSALRTYEPLPRQRPLQLGERAVGVPAAACGSVLTCCLPSLPAFCCTVSLLPSSGAATPVACTSLRHAYNAVLYHGRTARASGGRLAALACKRGRRNASKTRRMRAQTLPGGLPRITFFILYFAATGARAPHRTTCNSADGANTCAAAVSQHNVKTARYCNLFINGERCWLQTAVLRGGMAS